ncbi:MAG: NAD(P) transhydrogenase subunit alpha [Acidimicrobiia bacterium]
MRIGVPSQTAPGERRVALTPEVVAKLVSKGHVVAVEAGAGLAAGHSDPDYVAAGAEMVDRQSAWTAEFIASVDRPPAGVPVTGAILGLLRPFDDVEGIGRLASTGVTAFAFEAVPRTTRAQVVDALSSQATIAGYRAVLEAANRSDRMFPMMTTAAGTLRPAKVVVLGAGVAGLQAIATARRLGAVVGAFDVRAAAAEQVRSLGATFIEVEAAPQDASTSGGYAQEVAADEQARILRGLFDHIAAADAVIATAAIPGRRAPKLVSREMVEAMRPGAVIVDLAAATGGNCEVTDPGQTIVVGGVIVVGDTDLVSRVPGDASRLYSRNVASFVELVTGDDGAFEPNWDDDIVSESCVMRDGRLVHPRLVSDPGATS